MIVKYKQNVINSKEELISNYGCKEFASPYRSTIPLIELAYGNNDLLKGLLPFSENAELVFEYETPVKKGEGPPSCTDLVILDNEISYFIEAKRLEPLYSSVEQWLKGGGDNREVVLEGWLEYINKRCNKSLTIENVEHLVYQVVHRFASVCKIEKEAELVYVLFCPQNTPNYLNELKSLKALVGDSIPIKLISMDITDNELSDLETRWDNKARDLSEEVRQILVEQNPAMRFCNIEKTEIVANK